VACGRRAPKAALRRFVAPGGALVADPAQRLPGRGAYVCDDACLVQALRRRAFHRAFRRPVAPPGPSIPPLPS
jgi:predicted RNA-binding protein YlxR (DUF448 family)